MDGQAVPDCPGCQTLARRLAEHEAKIVELQRLIDELRRGGKRQAAPFSKERPKLKPRQPGRKPGDGYGAQHQRSAPEQIDETRHAALLEVDGRLSLTIPPATNHRAEQAIRPSVVNRKVWGGNRTEAGASAQATLTTLLLTAARRHLDPLAWLVTLRQTPQPLLLHAGGR